VRHREYNSESRQAKLEASRQDREQIVKHVSSVEQTRQEQIEAENTLHTLLDLKQKVQAQDSHALRMYVDILFFWFLLFWVLVVVVDTLRNLPICMLEIAARKKPS